MPSGLAGTFPRPVARGKSHSRQKTRLSIRDQPTLLCRSDFPAPRFRSSPLISENNRFKRRIYRPSPSYLAPEWSTCVCRRGRSSCNSLSNSENVTGQGNCADEVAGKSKTAAPCSFLTCHFTPGTRHHLLRAKSSALSLSSLLQLVSYDGLLAFQEVRSRPYRRRSR